MAAQLATLVRHSTALHAPRVPELPTASALTHSVHAAVQASTDLAPPEPPELAVQDAELRQLLVDIARSHASSGRGRGRLSKHDDARRRFILEKALESLRLGALVPESDMVMLRGGADWASMEAWVQRQQRPDPRAVPPEPPPEPPVSHVVPSLHNFADRGLDEAVRLRGEFLLPKGNQMLPTPHEQHDEPEPAMDPPLDDDDDDGAASGSAACGEDDPTASGA